MKYSDIRQSILYSKIDKEDKEDKEDQRDKEDNIDVINLKDNLLIEKNNIEMTDYKNN